MKKHIVQESIFEYIERTISEQDQKKKTSDLMGKAKSGVRGIAQKLKGQMPKPKLPLGSTSPASVPGKTSPVKVPPKKPGVRPIGITTDYEKYPFADPLFQEFLDEANARYGVNLPGILPGFVSTAFGWYTSLPLGLQAPALTLGILFLDELFDGDDSLFGFGDDGFITQGFNSVIDFFSDLFGGGDDSFDNYEIDPDEFEDLFGDDSPEPGINIPDDFTFDFGSLGDDPFNMYGPDGDADGDGIINSEDNDFYDDDNDGIPNELDDFDDQGYDPYNPDPNLGDSQFGPPLDADGNVIPEYDPDSGEPNCLYYPNLPACQNNPT
tara:strand:- start:843 stop:1814 length:972 start_codon:yes stop_codon:yes gene_type:complete